MTLDLIYFGLWSLGCVFFGACVMYRRQRGHHPAQAAIDVTKALGTKLVRMVKPNDNEAESPRDRIGL